MTHDTRTMSLLNDIMQVEDRIEAANRELLAILDRMHELTDLSRGLRKDRERILQELALHGLNKSTLERLNRDRVAEAKAAAERRTP